MTMAALARRALNRQDSRKFEPLGDGELFFETFKEADAKPQNAPAASDGDDQQPRNRASSLVEAFNSQLSAFEGSADITGDERALLQLTRHGGSLIKHGRRGKPHEKTIIRIRARLYWMGPKAILHRPIVPDPVLDRFILLHEVRELLVGKQTEVFHRKDAASAPEDCCFSLVLRDRTLDLQCRNTTERDNWFRALVLCVEKIRAAAQKVWLERQRRLHHKHTNSAGVPLPVLSEAAAAEESAAANEEGDEAKNVSAEHAPATPARRASSESQQVAVASPTATLAMEQLAMNQQRRSFMAQRALQVSEGTAPATEGK